MYTLSDHCPRRSTCVQHGKGEVKMKDLATQEQMYNHARLFSHLTLEPGCSIGRHCHEHETEWYYILKGEAVFDDNGKEVLLHAGDVAATGYGEAHSLENKTGEAVELIALIIME